jgi:hypothetical protein
MGFGYWAKSDYDEYIRVFNTGNDALLLERFFDENVSFSGLFAEIDMDFHASKERAELPFGHLHPGDLVTW